MFVRKLHKCGGSAAPALIFSASIMILIIPLVSAMICGYSEYSEKVRATALIELAMTDAENLRYHMFFDLDSDGIFKIIMDLDFQSAMNLRSMITANFQLNNLRQYSCESVSSSQYEAEAESSYRWFLPKVILGLKHETDNGETKRFTRERLLPPWLIIDNWGDY